MIQKNDDMNKNTLTKMIFGAALLLFASCTQDELADNADALPEGQYPVEIASVTISGEGSVQPWGARSPQTRAEESADGNTTQWEVGDVFYVKFSGSNRIGTYKITDAEAGTVEAVEPLYWQSKTREETLVAWYNSQASVPQEESTLSLSDQTEGMAYVLRTDDMSVSYSSAAVSLQFEHKLAKLRVYVQGTAYEGNAESVQISNVPTKATVTCGTFAATGETGTIAMHPTTVDGTACFEANLLPGTLGKDGAFTVTLTDGNTHTVSLNSDMTLEAGNRHDVKLKLHKKGTQEIDLSKQTGTYTISDNGTYFFTGIGSNGIKVTDGNPTICLANATISVGSGNAIDITGSDATIHVQGSNSVASNSGAGIYVAQNSTVTIKGGSRNDVLTATGGEGGAGIGGYINDKKFVACGNINIDNITLSAQGYGNSVGNYPPGIGGMGKAACGTISISNAIVHAYASYISSFQSAPAIGMGNYANETGSSILTIQIENSTIYAHRGAYADYIGQPGNINDDKSGRILFGTGGYCKSSTVYCYTSDTLDKTMVYDENGAGTQQQ